MIRQTSKVQVTSQESDIAMEWLCTELEEASGKGNILELSEVWERYCDLCRETNEEIPASFKGTHTVYFSSSFYIINQKPMVPRTDFHCITKYVVRSSV